MSQSHITEEAWVTRRMTCVRFIGAHALRLKSRAGTKGSTVSSLNCDCWLILGSEMLGISRFLYY